MFCFDTRADFHWPISGVRKFENGISFLIFFCFVKHFLLLMNTFTERGQHFVVKCLLQQLGFFLLFILNRFLCVNPEIRISFIQIQSTYFKKLSVSIKHFVVTISTR